MRISDWSSDVCSSDLDLTSKDITRPVVLDVTLNKAADHPMTKRPAIGFDATATIKRSDFDVAMYVPNVGEEVELRITTEAMARAAGRRVGKECVSTCRSRWSSYLNRKKHSQEGYE